MGAGRSICGIGRGIGVAFFAVCHIFDIVLVVGFIGFGVDVSRFLLRFLLLRCIGIVFFSVGSIGFRIIGGGVGRAFCRLGFCGVGIRGIVPLGYRFRFAVSCRIVSGIRGVNSRLRWDV